MFQCEIEYIIIEYNYFVFVKQKLFMKSRTSDLKPIMF